MESIKKAMKKIIKFIKFVLLLPLYWISFLFFKEKKLWVFGSWFGERYSDNSKYVFEYVQKNEPDIRAVWLSHRKDIVKMLELKGYEAYLINSFKGYITSAKASVYFFTQGLVDVNSLGSGRGLKIQLWHGVPLKKIGYDDTITRNTSITFRMSQKLIPFINEVNRWSYIISSSDYTSKIFQSAFRKPKEHIVMTGYPRSDIILKRNPDQIYLINELKKKHGKCKVIGYFPTFRNDEKHHLMLFNKGFFNLNQLLEELNVILLVKFHFGHLDIPPYYNEASRIIFLTEEECEDINFLLPHLDLILTDYSGVFYDYLLLNRPMIFIPFDIEEYLTEDREFYDDYFESTPGIKCSDWDEVGLSLKKIIGEKVDEYKKQRNAIKEKVHNFEDLNNCKRIVEFVKKEMY